MSSLKQKIMDDMKQAMRDKDTIKLNTIRMLRSEIKNFEIDHGDQDDNGIEIIVAKMIKQWEDAMEEYQNGNRNDLVEEAKEKVLVLKNYMAEQLSDEELKKIIQDVITETNQKNVGPIIGQVMNKVSGKATGKRVAEMVTKALGN
jgi:uncharacterized protein